MSAHVQTPTVMTHANFTQLEVKKRTSGDDPLIAIVREKVGQLTETKCTWCRGVEKLPLGNLSIKHLNHLAQQALEEADLPLQVAVKVNSHQWKITGEYPQSKVVSTGGSTANIAYNEKAEHAKNRFKLELDGFAIAQKAKELVLGADKDAPKLDGTQFLGQIHSLVNSYKEYPSTATLYSWRVDIPPAMKQSALQKVVSKLEKDGFKVEMTEAQCVLREGKIVVRQQLLISIADDVKTSSIEVSPEDDTKKKPAKPTLAKEVWESYQIDKETQQTGTKEVAQVDLEQAIKLFNSALGQVAEADPHVRVFAYKLPEGLEDQEAFVEAIPKEYQAELQAPSLSLEYKNVLPVGTTHVVITLPNSEQSLVQVSEV